MNNNTWVIYELIKNLEISTSLVFQISFSDTNISSFAFFFFIIGLYFLIPEMIVQMFNPTAEIVIPRETQINGGNAEIEMPQVTVETKISKFST